jgi:putative ABC transport system permease protein
LPAKPEELWRIGDKIRRCNWGGYVQGSDGDFALFSWQAYKNFREHTPEFADLAALPAGNAPLGVRRGGSQAPVDTRNGKYVSGNFFRTLGVQPWMGRLMTDADDRVGAPLVAVMSYRVPVPGELPTRKLRVLGPGSPTPAIERIARMEHPRCCV